MNMNPLFPSLFWMKGGCTVQVETLQEMVQLWLDEDTTKTSQELRICPIGKVKVFSQNCEVWSKLRNLVEIEKFDQSFEIWWKL